MFFESIISFIISFLFGASTLVIGARNPIHSILILILVFFLGSILLFLLSMEYFAILFLIVYVGAIVVLFLFIVMMLEIKMVNSSERFSDLFSFKNIILGFLVLEILFFSNEEFWDITPVFENNIKFNWNLTEINLYTDYSKVLNYIGQLKSIGGILFSQYFIAIILISILLFVSMFGSIVMTLESTKRIIIKQQDATLQGFRTPVKEVVVNTLTVGSTVIEEYSITNIASIVAIGIVSYGIVVYVVPFVLKYFASASIAKIVSLASKHKSKIISLALLPIKLKVNDGDSINTAQDFSRISSSNYKLPNLKKNTVQNFEHPKLKNNYSFNWERQLELEKTRDELFEIKTKFMHSNLAKDHIITELSKSLDEEKAGRIAAESAKVIAETNILLVIKQAIEAVTRIGAAVENAVAVPQRNLIEHDAVAQAELTLRNYFATKPQVAAQIVENEVLKATNAGRSTSIYSMNKLSDAVIEAVNTAGVMFNEWIQQFGG